MKILRVSLQNFRQFASTEVNFDVSNPLALNLVVATNEVGKSTLLNSIHFCFYGNLLANPKDDGTQLSNSQVFDRLADGEDTTIAVEIDFVHGSSENTFKIRRYVKTKKVVNKEVQIENELTLVNSTIGAKIQPAQPWVKRHVPASMLRFVLFSGERFEELVKESNLEQLGKDIKLLSGLDRIEPLIKACRNISEIIYDQARRKYPADERGKILESINGTKALLDTQKSQLEATKELLESRVSEKQNIDKFLSDKREAILAQRDIDDAKELLTNSQATLSVTLENQADFIGKFGWLSLFSGPVKLVMEKLSNDYSGEIDVEEVPRNFYQGVLEKGICICGRHLASEDGSAAAIRRLVQPESPLENPSAYRTLDAFSRVDALSPSQRGQQWRELNAASLECVVAIDSANEKLAETFAGLTLKVDPLLNENIQRKEALESEIPEIERALNEQEEKSRELSSRIKDLELELERISSRDSVKDSLLAQRKALQRVQASIENDANHLDERVRNLTEENLKSVLPKVLGQSGLSVQLTKEYKVKLLRNNRPMNGSTGRDFLTTFALVKSLYKAAKQLQVENSAIASDLDFPLILDAGFSTLDLDFTKKALSILVGENQQIILLLRPQDADAVVMSGFEVAPIKRMIWFLPDDGSYEIEPTEETLQGIPTPKSVLKDDLFEVQIHDWMKS